MLRGPVPFDRHQRSVATGYAEQFGDVIDVEELELVILVVVHGGSFRLLLAFVCRH